jgi:hypothetical protein
MKRVIFTVVLSLAVPCWAGSSELQSVLGRSVKISQGKHRSVVEYCPDNTCERFVAPGAASLPALHDFAFAYLFSVSGYWYLKSFQATPFAPEVSAVLERHRSACPQSQPSDAALCVVHYLARKNKIKVSEVRYDEGGKVEDPVTLPGGK